MMLILIIWNHTNNILRIYHFWLLIGYVFKLYLKTGKPYTKLAKIIDKSAKQLILFFT